MKQNQIWVRKETLFLLTEERRLLFQNSYCEEEGGQLQVDESILIGEKEDYKGVGTITVEERLYLYKG